MKYSNETYRRHPAAIIATSGLAGVGVLLNVFVIIRIMGQGLRRSHFSKLFYLSLAVTDLVMAGCSLGYAVKSVLKFRSIFIVQKGTMIWYGATGIAWLAITSNLFHVVAITADRFVATTFPFTYRTLLTRTRVSIGIGCIWMISAVLVGSVALHHRIAFWFGGIGIPVGSFGIIATYACIVFVTIKRKRLQLTRTNQNQGPILPDDVINSINTIFLGLSITMTYVVCNIPLCVVFMNYLVHDRYPNEWISALHCLITANAVLDPLWYTLFDLIRLKMKQRKETTTDKGRPVTMSEVK